MVFFLENKKGPPGPCGPSGVLRKTKLASKRSGRGNAKMAAEEKLTTPTNPNPTPPITTHWLQLSTLWLSNGRSLVRQLLTKDTPTPRTTWPWSFQGLEPRRPWAKRGYGGANRRQTTRTLPPALARQREHLLLWGLQKKRLWTSDQCFVWPG